MLSVIELNNVSKYYGQTVGVQSITLKVPKGTVFGFLGPNGAGKTTTISMLVNLIKPSQGNIKIFGLDNQTQGLEVRRRFGYLAGDMAMDRSLTGRQQLEYLGSLRGGFDKKYTSELAERLNFNMNRKFKTLSRGNKQKLGLIAALMNKPELLILDEPTSGLDPLIQSEFNKIILEHKAAGLTTFISSHVLSEVQELCDQVAFVKEGKLIANKPLAEITKAAPKQVSVKVASGNPKTCISGLSGVKDTVITGNSISFSYTGDQTALLTRLAKSKIIDVLIQEADLEEIFMKYYEASNVK